MAISLNTAVETGDKKGTFGNSGPSIRGTIREVVQTATDAGEALDMKEIVEKVQAEIADADAKKIATAVNDLYYAHKLARSVDDDGNKNFYIGEVEETPVKVETTEDSE